MTARIPATIITGFLGAGKTTLLRHLLAHARGRRIAVIVNEFGSVGIDGALLADCADPDCGVIELANGCLCCTVAEDFVPAMQSLLGRAAPPDHIVIETSGLALPKPLLKAFAWPDLRARVSVDGVIAVLDAPAIAGGDFADNPQAVADQRAQDPSLDHDNPLAEVYQDQLAAADILVLNKSDRVDAATLARLRAGIVAELKRPAAIIAASHGRIDPAILLGLGAAAEADFDSRPSLHDDAAAHDHDDFDSCAVEIEEADSLDTLLARIRAAAERHALLRVKGFATIRDKRLRAVIQAVGTRAEGWYDRAPSERRAGLAGPAGRLVAIFRAGLDHATVAAALRG